MRKITFVTANPNKLSEAQAILPFPITSVALELEEIQTLDVEKIVAHKLRQAYAQVTGPVMIDDVSAELKSLHGLPGPFIKFFEQQLGQDALYKLAKVPHEQAVIVCTLGYYDGKKQIIIRGELRGTVVAPRGDNGWGFDKVIVPNGHTQTMAEMSPEEKNKLSHRYVALMHLARELKK